MAKVTPDLEVGSMYGNWKILEYVPQPREKYYKVECTCGTVKLVSKSNLVLGKSKSCNKGICKKSYKSHGLTNSPLYKIWCGIKHRIKNPTGNNSCYEGISMCTSWNDFKNFYDWALQSGYKTGLSIDRIDSTKGYSPENCRWTTDVVQSQNRRKHKSKELPKGVYYSKPRSEPKYQGAGKAPYYWIVIYMGKRHQKWGFESPEEAYRDRLQFIKDNYDGLVYPD